MPSLQKRRKILSLTAYFLTAVFFVFVQQYQATLALLDYKNMADFDPKWLPCNLLVMAVPFLVLFFISRRLDVTTLVSAILVAVLSYANYNVLLYHGSPFFASDIFSIGAALDVAGGYRPVLDQRAMLIWNILFGELAVWLLLYGTQKCWFRRKFSFPVPLVSLAADVLAVYLVFFSPMTLFPKNLIGWSWEICVIEYGYPLCLTNSVSSLLHPYEVPEGYNAEAIQVSPAVPGGDERPDLIVILNETLCDISQYADVPESRALFEKMAAIPGVSGGYAVCSLIGGGTNNTEFELLTSNSMTSLKLSAPFSSLSMANRNSVVSYLNQLGYTTTAMHPCEPANYGRNRAYPDLGFDYAILGDAHFHFEAYGNRGWRDVDNYQDMMNWYESLPEDPRFVYLLTYQNHGGYNRNPSELDTITIQTEQFGKHTEQINEYLTSIEQSVDAFEALTQQLSAQERPVVVLMVGDHAPSFLRKLPSASDLSEAQREILLRTVPYYFWSNIPLQEDVIGTYASMTDLIPMLLKAAGMPTSSFYETILELNRQIPVRTYSGHYRDAQGNTGVIAENSQYQAAVRNYQFLMYDHLRNGSDQKYQPPLSQKDG